MGNPPVLGLTRCIIFLTTDDTEYTETNPSKFKPYIRVFGVVRGVVLAFLGGWRATDRLVEFCNGSFGSFAIRLLYARS